MLFVSIGLCNSHLLFQFEVEATDLSNPMFRKKSDPKATVIIKVERNKNDPKFKGLPYTAKIVRNARGGSQVKQLEATDADKVVSLNSSSVPV